MLCCAALCPGAHGSTRRCSMAVIAARIAVLEQSHRTTLAAERHARHAAVAGLRDCVRAWCQRRFAAAGCSSSWLRSRGLLRVVSGLLQVVCHLICWLRAKKCCLLSVSTCSEGSVPPCCRGGCACFLCRFGTCLLHLHCARW